MISLIDIADIHIKSRYDAKLHFHKNDLSNDIEIRVINNNESQW